MASELTIKNSLSNDIVVYDSYADTNEQGDDSDTYFGTLTNIGTVKSNTTSSIAAIHSPVATLIIMSTDGQPVARYVSMFNKTSFEVTQDDVTAMALATEFVNEISQSPDSEQAKQFAAIKNTANNDYAKAVDEFFAGIPKYSSVTFPLYMMALTTIARNPKKTPNVPIEKQPYSMALLCNYLGGDWPSEFPDILVTDFKCSDKNNVLVLKGTLAFKNLPFENSTVGKEILSLVPVDTVEVEFALNMQVGLNMLGTRLRFIAPDFHIPDGNGKTITIANPTVELDIAPTFKFVVFKASATIPFSVFNKRFNTNISMVIDNVEMEIGSTIDTDPTGLEAPPPIKGVFFDEFGVGMGVIFEPPSVAVGLDGKFHIGEGTNVVQLDDDQFTIVCAFEEEIPNPLYLAFNVPKLDFAQAIEIFTDSKPSFDFPISLEDLSFRWSENPLEPVVLPDGSLTNMGYGFSGYLELLAFKFYGDIEIDGHGLQGTIEMSPLTVGSILSLTGDGKGVKVKVDSNGNIIKNNQIPTTLAMKKAIESSTTKEIVPAGGPELTVSSTSSPFFTMGFSVKVLDATLDKTTAEVSKDGIAFDVDFGALLSTKMECTLQNFHNFNGNFSFGLDKSITLPSIGGFQLGTIPLKAEFISNLIVDTSTSDIDVSVKGGFDFEGIKPQIGPIKLDIDISSISHVISAIENEIEVAAATIFKDLYGLAEQWVKNVKQAVIEGIDDAKQVAKGLQQAFKKSEKEAAQIMKDAGYNIKDVGIALAFAFVGPGELVAQALVAAFNPSPDDLKAVLKEAGYTEKEIGKILTGLGGAFESLGKDILKGLKYLDPTKW